MCGSRGGKLELRDLLRNLRSIPAELFEALAATLEELDVRYCTGLPVLPESLGSCTLLKRLECSHSGLTSLPSSIGGCVALEELNVSYCRALTALPESLSHVSNHCICTGGGLGASVVVRVVVRRLSAVGSPWRAHTALPQSTRMPKTLKGWWRGHERWRILASHLKNCFISTARFCERDLFFDVVVHTGVSDQNAIDLHEVQTTKCTHKFTAMPP